MISPNTPMVKQQFIDLVASANAAFAAGKIEHGPFYLFIPRSPPATIIDRGGYVPGTVYGANEQVDFNGFIFISITNGNNAPPMDADGNPSSSWQQPWQDCYKRIRREIANAAAVKAADPSSDLTEWDMSMSGPWPCQNPSINYDQLAFYFEDTGKTESVTVSGTVSGNNAGRQTFAETELFMDIIGNHTLALAQPTSFSGSDTVGNTTALAGPPGQIRYRYINTNEFTVVIGGTTPVPINVTFSMQVGFIAGATSRTQATADGASIEILATYDESDPTSLIQVDVSNWIPGAPFTGSPFTGYNYTPGHHFAKSTGIVFASTVNKTVNPGRYTVRFSSSASPNNRASGTLTQDSAGPTFSGFIQWQSDTFAWFSNAMPANGSMTVVYSDAVFTPGVDNVKAIKKIQISDFNGLGPGVVLMNNAFMNPGLTSGFVFPFGDNEGAGIVEIHEDTPANPGTVFSDKLISIMAIVPGISISTSTPGFWFGITPPINSLRMLPFDQMQYNKFPTTEFDASGKVDATINWYLNQTPPYSGGQTVTGAPALPAYALTAPTWEPGVAENELLTWPKRWKANIKYPVGYSIIDSYGNLQTLTVNDGRSGAIEPSWGHRLNDITQEPTFTGLIGKTEPGAHWQCTKVLRKAPTLLRATHYTVGQSGIDDNGNNQQCTVEGVTGVKTPDWQTLKDALTVDGTATFKLTRVNLKIAPAVAKITPPIYEFFWQNPVTNWMADTKVAKGEIINDPGGNTQTALNGGTTGHTQPVFGGLGLKVTDGGVQWECTRVEQPLLTDTNVDVTFPGDGQPTKFPFEFRPKGWWLYRVALNRVPQKPTTDKPPIPPIAVTLGCVRNGAFVAFGTYQTGQIIDAMWPVFTQTALAYQASERVDVQAEIITCGLNYSMWGDIGYPMAAAHMNDLSAVLAKLPV